MKPTEYVVSPYCYKVRVVDGEDGYLVASCLELPGCHAQGRTLSEAVQNIVDAIVGYVSLLEDEGDGSEFWGGDASDLPAESTTASSTHDVDEVCWQVA